MKDKSRFSVVAAIFGLLALAVWTASAGETGERGVFLKLLGYVPDNQRARTEVWLNDYVAASRALRVDRPRPEADYEAVVDYARQLLVEGRMLEGPYISGFDDHAVLTLGILRARAGYDLRDITASVVAGEPPARYSAILLDVPTEEVWEDLLQAQDLPAPEVQEHRGVKVLVWGDDFAVNPGDRLQPPAFDQFGRGANLAFPSEAIFYTLWTDGVREMIDASQGELPSLAQVEEYALMASALDGLGAYSAWLFGWSQSTEHFRDEGHCQRLLRPYVAFATGIGRDEGGFFMGLVLVHPSEEEAEENAHRLRERLETCWTVYTQRPWEEYFDLERLAIGREGRTLTAKVYFASEGARQIWIRWALYREPLLLHE